MSSVRVFAPATVANVACGFDILGFAVDAPGDEVELAFSDQPGVQIVEITGDDGKLPTDPTKNSAGVVVQAFLDHIGEKSRGVSMHLHKKMPIGSGLGSSSASSVAALYAVNELFGNPLTKRELLPLAMKGEEIACGSAHADNVAPALFGGCVLIRSYDPLDIIELPVPEQLHAIVIHPHVEVRTEDARKILRKDIPLKKAIMQWGNIAGLVAGFMKSDYELIGRSLQDVVIEPVRSVLIPCFDSVKQAAIDAGALGCSISGAGPSIFALSHDESRCNAIAQAMQLVFSESQIDSDAYISRVNCSGPQIIS